jgi:uncharacterized protein (DUF362 family)
MKNKCSINGDHIECIAPEKKMYDKNDVRSKDRSDTESKYEISRGLGAYKNAKKSVDKLGGMCKFVKDGDMVAVKANMTGGTPELPQTFTHKEVLSSVIDQIRDCGGNPFVYDSSMIWTKMEPIAEKSGFYEWGKKKNVPIVNLTHENRVKFKFDDGEVLGIDEASQPIVDADVIVNVPAAKTHIMTGITVGLKNMYGSLPPENKAKYHSKGINETIATVNKNFRANLTVVDMIMGCEGGGPLSCKEIDPHPDTVIASNDPVCADSATAEIMGYSEDGVDNIRHIHQAELMGVGNTNCAHGIENKIHLSNPKDYKWDKVKDKGGFASFVTDMTTKILEFKPMIPVFDVLADFGLGWTAYTFKGGMSDVWDSVLYMSDRFNQRIEGAWGTEINSISKM